MRGVIILALAASLAGCGDWPDLGIDPETEAGYPDLVPFDDLLDKTRLTEEDREEAAEIEEDLLARAEVLRLRAAILDQPVEDRAALEAMADRLEALANAAAGEPAR